MKFDELKFDFDDIKIIPKKITNIKSRNSIHVSYSNPFTLPIIAAPMDTVVDLKNTINFLNCRISVALPRTIIKSEISKHTKYFEYTGLNMVFVSYGLSEMKSLLDYYETGRLPLPSKFVLLDVANGHMQQVYDIAKKFKESYPEHKLMIGNIANPETYEWYARSGFIDYIRVGIGNGNGCLTTKQTGIGYPMGSLISECYKVKQTLSDEIDDKWKTYNDPKFNILQIRKPNMTKKQLPKIVADGGMKDYSDIIKSLALGADYVMVGSIFNKSLESSGQNYLHKWKINRTLAKYLYSKGFNIKKQFYGMSTKIAQKKMDNTILKTSEGVVRYRNVEYTLQGWTNNFVDYLKSAMSYSDATTIEDFIGKADIKFITRNAFNRFNK